MEIKTKSSDFKSLSKVTPKANFQSIYLLTSNVKRSLDALEYSELEAEITFGGSLFTKEKDRFSAKVQVSVTGSSPENEDKQIVFIEAEYILTYAVRDMKNILKKDLQVFCDINAIYNSWPYLREFVQSVCNRMEIPPLTLPLLKFRSSKESPTNKKQISKKKG